MLKADDYTFGEAKQIPPQHESVHALGDKKSSPI